MVANALLETMTPPLMGRLVCSGHKAVVQNKVGSVWPAECYFSITVLGRRSPLQRDLATFALHTGLRARELAGLQWAWEQRYRDLDRPLLFIPAEHHKNDRDRVVVMNDAALAVYHHQQQLRDARSPEDPARTWVFPSPRTGRPFYQLTTNQWQEAWREVGLPTEGFTSGFHNLRHTLGARLRSVGAPTTSSANSSATPAPRSPSTILRQISGPCCASPRRRQRWRNQSFSALGGRDGRVPCEPLFHEIFTLIYETKKALEGPFSNVLFLKRLFGAPGEIRTPDHLVRSQVLYPTELRARNSSRGCEL